MQGLSIFSFFIIWFLSSTQVFAYAPCPQVSFTEPQDVKYSSDKLLIVTHPSTLWDGRYSSKMGMDEAVKFAKSNQMTVIYLQGQDERDTYFFSDCNPDFWVSSGGGEFSFDITANHVYAVGGHWELCERNTQEDVMKSWSERGEKVNLTYTHILDGLYAYGGMTKYADPYREDLEDFLNIVSYRNPRDRWFIEKLSMLELMGIIKDKDLQIEHLKRNLPPYQSFGFFQDYKVVMVYNNEELEVLQQGASETSPVLTLEYVNTVYEDGLIIP
ncbi:MAG: hypothetical protein H6621_09045 [Halobacteriovoraceae bacterium]|nr:hypothetical protein [Halobacteriovoraceae bacterium]MCB9095200.1 hypothetical protein [Halobacteriovoraceae bacterium]